ncbi:MAG: hypothetical protein ACYTDT_08815 [Planctomycetota bacterium]|jgi:hypothetical protein
MNSRAILASIAAGVFAAGIWCAAVNAHESLPDQVRWTYAICIGVLCGAVSVKLLAQGTGAAIAAGGAAIFSTVIGFLFSALWQAETTGDPNWASSAMHGLDYLFVGVSGLIAFGLVQMKTQKLDKPLVDSYVADPGEFRLQEMQLGAEVKEKGNYLKSAANDGGQTRVIRPTDGRIQDPSTSGIDADDQPPGMR